MTIIEKNEFKPRHPIEGGLDFRTVTKETLERTGIWKVVSDEDGWILVDVTGAPRFAGLTIYHRCNGRGPNASEGVCDLCKEEVPEKIMTLMRLLRM